MSGNLIDVKMLRLASKRILGMASRGTPSTSISASPEAQVAARFYHERVVDHYNNPRNVGSFDKNDSTVGTGLVGAPACGDVMKLQIKVDEETGKVVDARFKTFGCGSAIASSSVATEWVKGKQLDEVLTIKNTISTMQSSATRNVVSCTADYGSWFGSAVLMPCREIAKHLSLPPVKLHCSMLAEDAIKAAIKDYEANRSKATANPEAKAV
ncbi:Iron-sulfur cluster assembly protein [Quillaja saponaria]|uniref:Iron-sulfur cluster assembly protein n=1 Tax=Quillaja saponaria TaxID=32244 RepID=A0AAD7KU86_QUISA|nr:Iron-sulfur cluster assembly protein [Quillaja saponaria]